MNKVSVRGCGTVDADVLGADSDAFALANPSERFTGQPGPKPPRGSKGCKSASSEAAEQSAAPDGAPPAAAPPRKAVRPTLELPEGFNGLETAQSWLGLCVADIGKANSTATQLTGMQVAASVREEILARVKDLEAAYVKLRDAVDSKETDNAKWRPLLEWGAHALPKAWLSVCVHAVVAFAFMLP